MILIQTPVLVHCKYGMNEREKETKTKTIYKMKRKKNVM